MEINTNFVDVIIYSTVFILGISFGSFINVIVDRLSKGKKINGRSKCDFCRKTLSPLDLIPIFSYIFLKGRCRYCNKKLSIQYPLVELLTGLLTIITYLIIENNLGIISLDSLLIGNLSSKELLNTLFILLQILHFIFIALLLWTIFLMDLKYLIIADELQISLALLSIPLFIKNPLMHSIGAIVISSIFYSIYRLTKRKGMGFGDVKLAFVIGLMLGLWDGLIAVYLGFMFGGIVGIVLLLLQKKKMKSKIAFGPFLVIGTYLMLFLSNNVHKIIIKILNF